MAKLNDRDDLLSICRSQAIESSKPTGYIKGFGSIGRFTHVRMDVAAAQSTAVSRAATAMILNILAA